MNRNSKPLGKPDGQNDARPVFDKDQPSEPAGGSNPGRYKAQLPKVTNDEGTGVPTGPRSQEGEPRDPPDLEPPPDEDVTDVADDRQAPPFTGEDVEQPRRRPDDRPSPGERKRQIH